MEKLDQFRIDRQEFVINGIRYARPGAEPILLVHGVMCNCFMWESMGRRLYEAGYDVWMPSLRGHGNANLRSFVKHPKKGSYSFTEMATEDMRAILDFVQAETKKKLIVIGHSNGANVARAALGGVVKNEFGETVLSVARATEMPLLVRGFIGLGATYRYKLNSREFNTLVTLGYRLSRYFRFGIPSVAISPEVLQNNGSQLERLPSLFEKIGFGLTQKALSPHILNLDTIEESRVELIKLASKSISALPADLAASYLNFIKSSKFVENNFDYETAFPREIHSLYIAGELDSLAPPSAIQAEAQRLQTFTGGKVEYFLSPDTGHTDLIIGRRAARIVGDRILEFIVKLQAQDTVNDLKQSVG